jgi:hypothetical protein
MAARTVAGAHWTPFCTSGCSRLLRNLTLVDTLWEDGRQPGEKVPHFLMKCSPQWLYNGLSAEVSGRTSRGSSATRTLTLLRGLVLPCRLMFTYGRAIVAVRISLGENRASVEVRRQRVGRGFFVN